MTNDKPKDKPKDPPDAPAPPSVPEIDPASVSDTKMCWLLFHTAALWAMRSGVDPKSIIAGLEAELHAWRYKFTDG